MNNRTNQQSQSATETTKPNVPKNETVTSQSILPAKNETSAKTATTEKTVTEQKASPSKNTLSESESETSSDSGSNSSSSSSSESEKDVLDITEKIDWPITDEKASTEQSDNEVPRKRPRFKNFPDIASPVPNENEPSISNALVAQTVTINNTTWPQAPQVQLQQSFAIPNSAFGAIQTQLMQMQQFQLSLAQLYSHSNQTSKKSSPNININIDNSGRRQKSIPKFNEEQKTAYNQEKHGLGKNARRRLKRRITGSKPYQNQSQRRPPPAQ